MKCSICGYRAKDIGHLGSHYRKKHPNRMKKKKPRKGSKQDLDQDRRMIYGILRKEGLI